MKQRSSQPTMTASVSLEDLEHALFWVSSPPEFDAAAFVSRTTGKLFLRGADGPVDDDFPEDIDDGLEYIAVPHRNELGLGRQLVYRFVEDAAPHLRHKVQEAFRRRGAYARFKALLDDNSLLWMLGTTMRALQRARRSSNGPVSRPCPWCGAAPPNPLRSAQPSSAGRRAREAVCVHHRPIGQGTP